MHCITQCKITCLDKKADVEIMQVNWYEQSRKSQCMAVVVVHTHTLTHMSHSEAQRLSERNGTIKYSHDRPHPSDKFKFNSTLTFLCVREH